eukprot:TRINITY_DN4033_c0_g1_i1.p1 TRINITY_DN4033_c0_g1~~TRINITY_DN4033_c0_g1_i1.p1  ORF type:complete len:990 (-),score=273.65 TRINITY_DN4033_c0_g1_i1:136-3105(-)
MADDGPDDGVNDAVVERPPPPPEAASGASTPRLPDDGGGARSRVGSVSRSETPGVGDVSRPGTPGPEAAARVEPPETPGPVTSSLFDTEDALERRSEFESVEKKEAFAKMRKVVNPSLVTSVQLLAQWGTELDRMDPTIGLSGVSPQQLAKLIRVVQWIHADLKGKFAVVPEDAVNLLRQSRNFTLQETQEVYVEKSALTRATSRILSLEKRVKEEVQVETSRLGEEVEALWEASRRSGTQHQHLDERLNTIVERCDVQARQLREGQNRIDNTSDRIGRAMNAIEDLRKRAKAADQLKKDMEQIAQVVASLTKDVRALQTVSNEQEEKLAGVAAAAVASANTTTKGLAADDGRVEALSVRLEQVEGVQKQLAASQNKLEAKVKSIKLGENQVAKLEQRLTKLDQREAAFEKQVAEELLTVKATQAQDAMADFLAKWNPFKTKKSVEVALEAWAMYTKKCLRFRQAMSKTRDLYGRSHVRSRLREWSYVAQKNMSEIRFQKLDDATKGAEEQVENLQKQVVRNEKANQEHYKTVASRLTQQERGMEGLVSGKADKTSMQDQFHALHKRLEVDYDLAPFKAADEEMLKQLRFVQATKMDVTAGAQIRDDMNVEVKDLRTILEKQSAFMSTRASVKEVGTKAEAATFEQVVTMLAKQADQLATLVAGDLECMRSSLARFLELSPDMRKAALSLGLKPNERCVMCGPTEKPSIEPALGSDWKRYGNVKDEREINSALDQAKEVFAEKLKMPSVLLSSLAAGLRQGVGPAAHKSLLPLPSSQNLGSQSYPPAPQAAADTEGSLPGVTPRRQLVPRSQTPQQPLQNLNQLFGHPPGWSARRSYDWQNAPAHAEEARNLDRGAEYARKAAFPDTQGVSKRPATSGVAGAKAFFPACADTPPPGGPLRKAPGCTPPTTPQKQGMPPLPGAPSPTPPTTAPASRCASRLDGARSSTPAFEQHRPRSTTPGVGYASLEEQSEEFADSRSEGFQSVASND